MKKLLVMLLLSSFYGLAQDGFPAQYVGNYKGILKIQSKQGTQEIPMEFHLQPTDTLGTYHYTLVYGEGDQRQERPYFLKTLDHEKGQYLVDEDNGIILLEQRFGNSLYSLFEVNESLLTTFITFYEDSMDFEITFSAKKEQQISYATQDSTKVIAYPISTRQHAVLKKQ